MGPPALLVCTYVFSFLMAFSIGSNDAANALATSYGSEAAPLLLLVILGAIFEFIGSFWCSGTVAATLATKMIPEITTKEPIPETQDQLMFVVSLASFLFIIVASVFGMPISGTHTVIGALIGAGVSALGRNAISYSYITRIVVSWFVSPVLAAALCFVFILLVSVLTLNGAKASLRWRLFNLQLVTGAVFTLMLYMILILVQKNIKAKNEPLIDDWQYGLLPVSFVVGWLACRFFMAFICKHESSIW